MAMAMAMVMVHVAGAVAKGVKKENIRGWSCEGKCQNVLGGQWQARADEWREPAKFSNVSRFSSGKSPTIIGRLLSGQNWSQPRNAKNCQTPWRYLQGYVSDMEYTAHDRDHIWAVFFMQHYKKDNVAGSGKDFGVRAPLSFTQFSNKAADNL